MDTTTQATGKLREGREHGTTQEKEKYEEREHRAEEEREPAVKSERRIEVKKEKPDGCEFETKEEEETASVGSRAEEERKPPIKSENRSEVEQEKSQEPERDTEEEEENEGEDDDDNDDGDDDDDKEKVMRYKGEGETSRESAKRFLKKRLTEDIAPKMSPEPVSDDYTGVIGLFRLSEATNVPGTWYIVRVQERSYRKRVKALQKKYKHMREIKKWEGVPNPVGFGNSIKMALKDLKFSAKGNKLTDDKDLGYTDEGVAEEIQKILSDNDAINLAQQVDYLSF